MGYKKKDHAFDSDSLRWVYEKLELPYTVNDDQGREQLQALCPSPTEEIDRRLDAARPCAFLARFAPDTRIWKRRLVAMRLITEDKTIAETATYLSCERTTIIRDMVAIETVTMHYEELFTQIAQRLSRNEKKVFYMRSAGRTHRQIASKLSLSLEEVTTILRKVEYIFSTSIESL